MTGMIAWPTWLVWLIWISLLFLFYFILSYYKFSKSYFLAFWAWGNGSSSIWKENQQNFFKKRFCFQKDSTYIISMGESVIKGKKTRKESRLQKEGMRGFSSSRFGVFLWGRLTYIRERRKREAFWFSERKRNKRKESRFKKEEKNKKEREILGKRWRGAQEQGGEIAAKVLSGTLPVIFIIILVFPFTFTWDSLAVFEKLFLLIGMDIEGHLFALLNRNFLQTCSIMIVFLISLILFINSWNRDLWLNFNVCGILI